jgi:glyoxylase-like metal-dependent hydrolase (beta-lactamase superfamily II)
VLTDGQHLPVGCLDLEVLHTPGHSPGSVSLYVREAELVIAGDTLFAGGIGRTDVFGGNFPTLVRSIRDRLYSLPGNTRVIAGHGPETLIGREREHNPFVRS